VYAFVSALLQQRLEALLAFGDSLRCSFLRRRACQHFTDTSASAYDAVLGAAARRLDLLLNLLSLGFDQL
jgi:hypothetical protein